MPCKACGSSTQSEFPAELTIHFPGPQNLNKPPVLSFQQLAICLDCGYTEIFVPDTERQRLRNHTPGKKMAGKPR